MGKVFFLHLLLSRLHLTQYLFTRTTRGCTKKIKNPQIVQI